MKKETLLNAYWNSKKQFADIEILHISIDTPKDIYLSILKTIKANNGLKSLIEARNRLYSVYLFA